MLSTKNGGGSLSVLGNSHMDRKGDINSRQLFAVVPEGQDFALGLVFANSESLRGPCH